jgi:RimJ/RimL family protein N-acetyltransferase
MILSPVPLEGHAVRLTPLDEAMLAELTSVALSAPSVWAHIPYRMATVDDVRRVAGQALALQVRGEIISFATRLCASGELIGGTTIRVVDAAVPSVEIGGTWIVPRHQRTNVNTEAKLLQLTHCFDGLGCARVELKTDILNERSRAAILRLGASQEGILRSHMRRADGSLRDSVLFSIVAREWPGVRQRLQQALSR